MHLILIVLNILGGYSPASHAGQFEWCRALADIPQAELLNAKVPEHDYTKDKDSKLMEDGTWVFDKPLAEVWEIYTQNPLRMAWNSKTIQYRYSIDPTTKKVIDESNPYAWPGLKEGLKFYLDILAEPTGHICKMGMGVQVTEVKPLHSIKYEYLDFSPAFGSQWIVFESLGESRTRVRHMTQYRGKNFVIENTYLTFHREAIPSFHKSVQALVAQGRVGRLPVNLDSVIKGSMPAFNAR